MNAIRWVFRQEVRKVRQLSDGPIGVNITVALTDYENLVRAAVEEKADIIISGAGLPLGLPGRVIDNNFVAQIKQGKTVPFTCKYHCLRSCDPQKPPYCIAEVLTKAAQGRLHESFAFAGSNAHRCHEIVPVQTLVDTLSAELAEALAANPALRPLRTSSRKSRETQQACARVIEQTLNELQ